MGESGRYFAVSKRYIRSHTKEWRFGNKSAVIRGDGLGHLPLKLLRQWPSWGAYSDRQVYAVIRDPIDRFYSSVNFINQGGVDGSEFLKQRQPPEYFFKNRKKYQHFRSQSYYISGVDDAVLNLINFERLSSTALWYSGEDIKLSNRKTKLVNASKPDFAPENYPELNLKLKKIYKKDLAIYYSVRSRA